VGWCIFLAIIAVLTLLTLFSLTLTVEYCDSKLDFRVTYLFVQIFPFRQKRKKPKKSKKKDKPSFKQSNPETDDSGVNTDNQNNADSGENPEAPELESSETASPLPETEAATSNEATKTKRSLAEIIEIAKSVKEKLGIIYGSSSKGLRRIMRHIIVDSVNVDFTIRGTDAAKTAVNYGIISGVIYGIIAIVSSLAAVYIDNCDIACDFNGTESTIFFRFKEKIRLVTLLISGLAIGTKLLRRRKELFGKTEDRSQKTEDRDKVPTPVKV
jgi:hypothetical protein